MKRKIAIEHNGFTVVNNFYSPSEVDQISACINQISSDKETFRKSADLFAIRQFLKEVPQVKDLIFNTKLKSLIIDLFGSDYFVVKSIYFDKPATSNWYVAYHQDLTISVDRKTEINGYGPWTNKQNQYAVQPPLTILENSFTIRIHLDETSQHNGALKVIPGSHLQGIRRPEIIDWNNEQEVICDVTKGGLMIMKPLLLHRSGRTINNQRRRVIHIEFCNQALPNQLCWAEKLSLSQ